MKDDEENHPKVKWVEEYCHSCGKQLNSWDVRCSKAMAYEHHICEDCMANEYGKSTEDLRSVFEAHFGMIPCLGI